jgi:radical SAM superfamily enzyme YgiQ (UPF0313 family)
MKILFLEIDTEREWALASVGPAYIASYIRLHGHEATLLRVRPEEEMDELIATIEKEAPDILGFSLTTRQWLRGAHVAGEIRKKLYIPVIAGGHHPTFAAESVLQTEGFDYVCLGDGEEPVAEILDCLEKGKEATASQIANIWAQGGSRPDIRPPLKPLDKIPFLARDLLDERYGVVHLITQRGCPFPCTFCAAGGIRDLYKNEGYLRRRTVQDVVKELYHMKGESPLNYVVFLDDTFTVNKAWVEEFCRVYGKEVSTYFSINARVETVDRDTLAQLAKAGCRHIIYGVESGSSRMRREVLHRPVDNQRIIDAFNWTKKASIMVTANYMLGLPGETAEDIEQTLALNEELQPDDFEPIFFLCAEKNTFCPRTGWNCRPTIGNRFSICRN